MAEVNRRTGRPVTFGLAQSNAGPELFHKYPRPRRRRSRGRRRAPTADDRARHRPALRLAAPHVLRPHRRRGSAAGPSPLDARLAVLDDDTRRAELSATPKRQLPPLDWNGVYVLTADRVDYSADPVRPRSPRTPSAAGETIPEAFVRISRETRGRALFNFPFLNQRMDAVEELLDHPRMAIGLGDSGAHVGLIMDASLPDLVPRCTGCATARSTRSRTASGASRPTPPTCSASPIAACSRPARSPTSTCIDLDALALAIPEYVHDFPAQAGRYLQRSSGYRGTLVNGQVFVEDGTPQGVHAGVTLRS